MIALKITTVGNSTGVILPKEVLTKMNIRKGDILFLTETPEGYRITPYDPEFQADLELTERLMNRYRNALRELARD